MGSLIAAVASYCDIKQKGGSWQIRIDDLDPPRSAPNATESILKTLSAHGLESDTQIIYQSQRNISYQKALNQLASDSFYCTCTRKKLNAFAVYPGTCRDNDLPIVNSSIRLRSGSQNIYFKDLVLGKQMSGTNYSLGDFIIQRKDGLFAYNLATAVDDANQISHVIRGQDLYATTPPQLLIMQKLNFTPPTYGHVPILTFPDGKKLSKQNKAPALDNDHAAANLLAAFNYLGFGSPENSALTVQEILQWGKRVWDLSRIPAKLAPFSTQL
jgi:glutamyl-Q tRNA(Asp) synthetase